MKHTVLENSLYNLSHAPSFTYLWLSEEGIQELLIPVRC
jgi:hypothetical protein